MLIRLIYFGDQSCSSILSLSLSLSKIYNIYIYIFPSPSLSFVFRFFAFHSSVRFVYVFISCRLGIYFTLVFLVLDSPNMEFLFGLDMLRKHQVPSLVAILDIITFRNYTKLLFLSMSFMSLVYNWFERKCFASWWRRSCCAIFARLVFLKWIRSNAYFVLISLHSSDFNTISL